MKTKVESIVKQAVEELNEQREADKKLVFARETKLIGKNAEVDSMEFITLISIIEELLADEFGKDIRIVSDKAFSMEHSPFRSIETLTDFIAGLLESEE